MGVLLIRAVLLIMWGTRPIGVLVLAWVAHGYPMEDPMKRVLAKGNEVQDSQVRTLSPRRTSGARPDSVAFHRP